VSDQLLTVAAAYCGLVAALALLAAVGIPCVPALRAGLVVAELLLVAQVLVDAVTLLRGHRPRDPATHLGYLATSVLLLPLLLGLPRRRPAAGPARADHLVAAVAAGARAGVQLATRAGHSPPWSCQWPPWPPCGCALLDMLTASGREEHR
jgi:hypothetical protein